MSFKEFLEAIEARKGVPIGKKNDYKKRRAGSITGAAARMRRGSGIADPVTPANLAKPDNSCPAGKVYKGMTIAGPDYKTISKIHSPFKNKKYF